MFNMKTEELLTSPPVDWDVRVSSLTPQEYETVVLDLADLMQRAAMLKGYIEGRRMYEKRPHEFAVKTANNLVTKVRRILGYAYPKQEISF